MAKLSFRSTDKKLHPKVATKMAALRGAITEAAEKKPLPPRFDAIEHPDKPAMILSDLETGRQIRIALSDYYGARKVLNAFFGDKVPVLD